MSQPQKYQSEAAICARAAECSDLDESVRIVQDHLGITTGDFAGAFFSGHEDGWKDMQREERATKLAEYIAFERQHEAPANKYAADGPKDARDYAAKHGGIAFEDNGRWYVRAVPAPGAPAKVAHTPEPWSHPDTTGTIYGSDGRPVARILRSPSRKPDHESDANGRLIAAAPELLAALRDLSEGLVDIPPERMQIEMTRRMVNAKAAIAKAEKGGAK